MLRDNLAGLIEPIMGSAGNSSSRATARGFQPAENIGR